jgi:hypothetical protein
MYKFDQAGRLLQPIAAIGAKMIGDVRRCFGIPLWNCFTRLHRPEEQSSGPFICGFLVLEAHASRLSRVVIRFGLRYSRLR